ncbi:hypothetical protein, partial [Xanthomonas sp. WHRI 8391]|uniref:hypothetical protein n=1 Tax=Xanthomonas sp. WHRI 8391 TaxID=3161573 RepID=UPI0032E8FF84
MSSHNARSDAGVVRLRDVLIDVSMSRDIAGQGPVGDGRCAWCKQCTVHVVRSPCFLFAFQRKPTNQQAFKKATDSLSGAVALPVAGPCGGMDAATEPPGMDSRRVPRAV